MNFYEKNRHVIYAIIGILLTVCGIVMTVIAASDAWKDKALIEEDSSINA